MAENNPVDQRERAIEDERAEFEKAFKRLYPYTQVGSLFHNQCWEFWKERAALNKWTNPSRLSKCCGADIIENDDIICSQCGHPCLLRDSTSPKPQEPEICQHCHQAYACWFAPNEIWNLVIPDRVGMLCPNCFLNRAEHAAINLGCWKIAPEFYGKASPRTEESIRESLQPSLSLHSNR